MQLNLWNWSIRFDRVESDGDGLWIEFKHNQKFPFFRQYCFDPFFEIFLNFAIIHKSVINRFGLRIASSSTMQSLILIDKFRLNMKSRGFDFWKLLILRMFCDQTIAFYLMLDCDHSTQLKWIGFLECWIINSISNIIQFSEWIWSHFSRKLGPILAQREILKHLIRFRDEKWLEFNSLDGV